MQFRINTPLELKFADGVAEGTLTGLASTFDNVDLDGDIIAPGAFAKGLAKMSDAGRLIPMLDHHDIRKPVGRWTKILETEKGLEVEGKLTMEVERARELYALAKDGALGGMSIGFMIDRDSYDRDKRARVIEEATVYEISLVSIPANPEARIAGVKMSPMINTRVDFERALCSQLGYSRNAAKAIAANGFKCDARNEPQEYDSDDLRKVADGANGLLQRLESL